MSRGSFLGSILALGARAGHVRASMESDITAIPVAPASVWRMS